HDRLMKEVTHLLFAERCLVQFQLFGSCNNSTMSDECSTKDDDKATTTKAYQAYFSGDKKLLTKYRMSFEVEWHRIEEQLFRLLSQLLIDSSEHLTRMRSHFDSDFADLLTNSDCGDSSLSVAFFERFKFVK